MLRSGSVTLPGTNIVLAGTNGGLSIYRESVNQVETFTNKKTANGLNSRMVFLYNQ
ncbi:MAG: hypothetical protein AB8Y77_00930 [Coxiella endosymbiont of Haemaphysalis japonica]